MSSSPARIGDILLSIGNDSEKKASAVVEVPCSLSAINLIDEWTRVERSRISRRMKDVLEHYPGETQPVLALINKVKVVPNARGTHQCRL